MTKPLSDTEIDEVKELLTSTSKVTVYVALLSAVAAIVSSVGTAAAAIIIAIKSK